MTKNEDTVRKIFCTKCVVCDEGMDVIHHVNGEHGDDTLSNLAPLCPNCHARAQLSLTLSKIWGHAKSLEELIRGHSLDQTIKTAIDGIKQGIVKDVQSARMVRAVSVSLIRENMVIKAQKYRLQNSPSSALLPETEVLSDDARFLAPDLVEMLEKCVELINGCKRGA